MIYLTITFKNEMKATYVAEEFRITRGFVKVVNSTYGNKAIPKSEVNTIQIVIMEDK